LIFSSDTKTKHSKDFIANSNVAGSIAIETKEVTKIQGIQLLGEITELKGGDLKAAKNNTCKPFHYARLMGIYLGYVSCLYKDDT